jgi:hypothetical protein
VTYIKRGNAVIYAPANEIATIMKVDYLHGQAEVDFLSGGSSVVGFKMLRGIDKEGDFHFIEESTVVEKDVPLRNENLINVFFKHYENEDGTYTIPKELLNNLLEHIFEEVE